MKQYYQPTDKIVKMSVSKTVKINEANMYFGKLTQSQRNSIGYYDVKYLVQPNRRYYNSVETKSIIDNVYTISYQKVEKNLDIVKDLMLKDLTEASEKYSNEAIIDTGLGFSVKAGRSNLEDFERGANRGILVARDIFGREHIVNKVEMLQVAADIETNGMLLYSTFWEKFDTIKGNELQAVDGFTTIDECVLYEKTPYEVEEEIVNAVGEPTGEGTHIVTKYRNNVKEW